ncbi:MAG: glycosyltransferase [Candidatus Magasanikbacteria bacterium]|nr:glycosyltransferase [Candidatus Magasanikbacteria bacterium]
MSPKVSVIIPTYNRPEFIDKAIKSVLNQTYQDFEVIVVDDGTRVRAEDVVKKIKDNRVVYIKHPENRGGGAARNTGIKKSRGEYVAFLDDDDEWLPEKLEIQMKEFEKAGDDVGFCFSSVINKTKEGDKTKEVYDGIKNFHEDVLRNFKGFLTVTLIIKRKVFDEVGGFDERFPSHQEPDLIIRVTKKYRGLGVNKPLVKVNMMGDHDHIGANLDKRIAGRRMILNKYLGEFKKKPRFLAKHYFQLAIFLRDDGEIEEASEFFKKAWKTNFHWRYFAHYVVMKIKTIYIY